MVMVVAAVAPEPTNTRSGQAADVNAVEAVTD
jgi:hypothetical protein